MLLAKFFANGKGLPDTPTEAPDEAITDDSKVLRIPWDLDDGGQVSSASNGMIGYYVM